MAGRIGVRDLKNRASEIVRDVHKRDEEYIVTVRGEPVAVLRPLSRESEGAHESRALLEALNRVYQDYSPTPEKEARRLMKQKQREMVQGEW